MGESGDGGTLIGLTAAAAAGPLSKKVDTAASRSQLWLSRKNWASSRDEEVISQKEPIRGELLLGFLRADSSDSFSIGVGEGFPDRILLGSALICSADSQRCLLYEVFTLNDVGLDPLYICCNAAFQFFLVLRSIHKHGMRFGQPDPT